MVKADKAQVVEEIKQLIGEVDGFALASFKGLTVIEITELRSKLREQGGVAKVYKNKLLKKAFEEKNVEGLDDMLKQTTLFVYGKDDFLLSLKAVAKFAKDGETLALKGGYLSGQAFGKEGIIAISKLPGRKELIGQVVGGINSVVSGFVGVLNGMMTGLIGTIEAVEKKNQE